MDENEQYEQIEATSFGDDKPTFVDGLPKTSQRQKLDLRITQLVRRSPPGSMISLSIVTDNNREIKEWYIAEVKKKEG